MKINSSVQKKRRIKIIAIVVVILLILSTIYTIVARSTGIWPFLQQGKNGDTNDIDTSINYDPPTKQEQESSQDAKQRVLDESDDKGNSDSRDIITQDTASKKTVTVGVSYADIYEGNLEIRAFTPSVIEGTGTCTATVSKAGSSTVTQSTPAFIDASSTICEPIYVPESQLTPGIWNIDVRFSSPTHQGSSGPIKIEV